MERIDRGLDTLRQLDQRERLEALIRQGLETQRREPDLGCGAPSLRLELLHHAVAVAAGGALGDDHRMDLVSGMHVPREGAARAQDLVVRMGRHDQDDHQRANAGA